MNIHLDPTEFAPIIARAVEETIARVREHDARARDAEVFTEAEAAAFLKVAPYVVRDARLRGEIHGRKVGRSYRYTRANLYAYLAQKG